MSDDPIDDGALRELLCEMLRLFYAKDWVSGTGGGICGRQADQTLLVAPTGVHKERVRPQDLFVLDSQGDIVQSPKDQGLKPSECSPIFAAIVRHAGAGSVVHSHALSCVLAADAAVGDALEIQSLEMLKGIRGLSNQDVHAVPIISNTSHERDLTGAVEAALADERFARSAAILVRDHGAYIWGDDVWEAKRHTEVYHFLFQAVYERSKGRT